MCPTKVMEALKNYVETFITLHSSGDSWAGEFLALF